MIIVNGLKPLTIITKSSTLDVAAVLDPPLLREHKFRRNFLNTINPLCSGSLEIDSNSHLFLRCENFITSRTNLIIELRKLDSNILNLDEISLTKLFLYGDSKCKNKVNKNIFLFHPFTLYFFMFYASLHGHIKVMKSCSLVCDSIILFQFYYC